MEWHQLTWAQQTFYQAKYGISVADKAKVDLSELSRDDSQRGSNERLRGLLAQERVSLMTCHPEGTLLHIGPDDSVVVTNGIGWGLPSSEGPGLYVELDGTYSCHWEFSQATWTPEPPYWATCPDS